LADWKKGRDPRQGRKNALSPSVSTTEGEEGEGRVISYAIDFRREKGRARRENESTTRKKRGAWVTQFHDYLDNHAAEKEKKKKNVRLSRHCYL